MPSTIPSSTPSSMSTAQHHAVAVVGGGPVGMLLATELGLHGVDTVVLGHGEFVVLDHEALLIGDTPRHALLGIEVEAEKRPRDELVGVFLRMRLVLDGRAAASMVMTIQRMPPQAWKSYRPSCGLLIRHALGRVRHVEPA